ncbi:hypothetical protein A7Q10_10975 [Methylacidiphilum caldifontis]|uniref:Uncharacterized protein n=2 Tax=Methylacidiphilum caldifontis TaxID=2795386 RepID=A0A4Y8PGR1_9BACT|nr:hypothetical protein A7Q10_10975 [Methylacidiphilum caldifontis]
MFRDIRITPDSITIVGGIIAMAYVMGIGWPAAPTENTVAVAAGLVGLVVWIRITQAIWQWTAPHTRRTWIIPMVDLIALWATCGLEPHAWRFWIHVPWRKDSLWEDASLLFGIWLGILTIIRKLVVITVTFAAESDGTSK